MMYQKEMWFSSIFWTKTISYLCSSATIKWVYLFQDIHHLASFTRLHRINLSSVTGLIYLLWNTNDIELQTVLCLYFIHFVSSWFSCLSRRQKSPCSPLSLLTFCTSKYCWLLPETSCCQVFLRPEWRRKHWVSGHQMSGRRNSLRAGDWPQYPFAEVNAYFPKDFD